MSVYPDPWPVLGTVSPYVQRTQWHLQPSVTTSFPLPHESLDIWFSTSGFTIPAKTPIPASDLLLGLALPLEMETTRDGFILRSAFVDEESFGTTFEEAYFDFLTSLRDRHRSLERRSALLSDGDRTIFKRLQNVLESLHG